MKNNAFINSAKVISLSALHITEGKHFHNFDFQEESVEIPILHQVVAQNKKTGLQ